MKQIAKDLFWAGSLDPELRVFDIIMKTEFGTTYNSFVLKGSEKTAVLECSKLKYYDSYVNGLGDIINIEDIDYIILNHTEPDHSGTLERMLEQYPGVRVVGTAVAINFLKEITNIDFNYTIVKNGDSLSLGGKTLEFIIAPNLHWPDSMFTYVPEIETLFTCDMFGCHYCGEGVTNDEIEDNEGYLRALKYYYDNIFGPFRTDVVAAINKIKDLSIKTIAVGHGPVLTHNPQEIIEYYKTWSSAPVKEERKMVVIPYVSAYGYTEMMAKKIEEGIKDAGDIKVRLFDMVTSYKEQVETAMIVADGLLFGTPTIVGEALKPIWDLTTSMNAKIHGGKYASAFGSYGWSGEAVPNIMARLSQLRLKLYGEGLRGKFKPDESMLQEAYEFGFGFGSTVMSGKLVAPKKTGTKRIWRCLVCGEIVEGDEPPAACPVCGVGPEQFEEVETETIDFISEKPDTILIIGGGVAAISSAEEIRKRNKVCSIEIISRESVPAYNRPMLTKGILSQVDELNLYLKSAIWYKDNNIKLTLDTNVEAVYPNKKEILISGGVVRKYDKLILATGAESFIPPIPGTDVRGVFSIRSLEDTKILRQSLKDASNALVIGGGVLGLEVAWEMKKIGKTVAVVEYAPYLMQRQLDAKAGEILKNAAEKAGVKVYTAVDVSEILCEVKNNGKLRGVKLSDGLIIPADIIIMSTGVKHNITLAEKAGIIADHSIIVDEKMAVNYKDIYACGDCASYKGLNYGIWMQAIEMGKVAGANAAGDSIVYEPVILSNAFSGFRISLFAVGDNGKDKSKRYKTFEIMDAAKGLYEKLYFVNNRFTGGILIGDVSKSAMLLDAFKQKLTLEDVLKSGLAQ